MLRPRRLRSPAVIAVAVAALLMALAPAGASLGGVGEGVAVSGLSRVAAWIVALVAVTVLALETGAEEPRSHWWPLAAMAVAVAVLRMPVGLAGILLLGAVLLGRLSPSPASRGLGRALALASLAGVAGVGAAAIGRQHGDEVLAATLVFGFLVALGALPFGWHLVRWLEEAPPGLAAMAATALPASLVAAVVAAEPVLATLRELPRAGLVIGYFGAATLLAASLWATTAPDWRTFAIRTMPGDVGLALVGVAGLDIRGLQGAALTLTVLAVSRPILLFSDRLAPRRGAGLGLVVLSLVAMAGLPPTMGFPARVLVLEASARLSPLLTALAATGAVVEAVALALVLRRRLATALDTAVAPGPHGRPTLAVAGLSALLLVGGGLLPGALLRYAFQLSS